MVQCFNADKIFFAVCCMWPFLLLFFYHIPKYFHSSTVSIFSTLICISSLFFVSWIPSPLIFDLIFSSRLLCISLYFRLLVHISLSLFPPFLYSFPLLSSSPLILCIIFSVAHSSLLSVPLFHFLRDFTTFLFFILQPVSHHVLYPNLLFILLTFAQALIL